jgi:translation initiation factor 2B subunit (eIF-2B alpha/beta/delta family)
VEIPIHFSEALMKQMEYLDREMQSNRRSLLRSRNVVRLDDICRTVIRAWQGEMGPYPYTPHDDKHCIEVERMLYKLLTVPKMKRCFSEAESFLLLASAWLHDIGMKPTILEGDKDSGALRSQLSTAEWDRHVREKHEERSAEYVRVKGKDLGLNDLETKHLMTMCLMHRHWAYGELQQLPTVTKDDLAIRIRLLVACLRLADALHLPDRTKVSDFKTYLALGLGPVQRFHWFKSKYVESVLPDHEKQTIALILKTPSHKTAPGNWKDRLGSLGELLAREVQNELDSIKDIFTKEGLFTYLRVIPDFAETPVFSPVDLHELGELVNHIELFDPTVTPNASSVVKSVLGEIRLLAGADRAEKGGEHLRDYCSVVLDTIVRERPDHVLLKKIRDALGVILSRRVISDAVTVRRAKAMVDNCAAKHAAAMRAMPRVAFGVISDGRPVLLYGYSETVVSCVEYYLRRARRALDIYVCEGRAKTAYRHNNRLVYCDCVKYMEALDKSFERTATKLRCGRRTGEFRSNRIHYITDSCASHLFSRNGEMRVLFGANSIGEDGSVAHTLGHLAIADMAKAYGIPVYVIAESLKIGHLDLGKDPPRGNRWLTTDTAYEPKIEIFTDLNPRVDIVPPERILEIITEKGRVSPTEVSTHQEDTWMEVT